MRVLKIFKKQENPKKEETATDGAVSSQSISEETKNETMKEQNQEQTTNQTPEKATVYNLIILDESGSMSAIYQEALTGVNETLQTIRMAKDEHPEQEHFVTLVAFDTGHYNEIYKGTPASKAVDITKAQYRPCGGTPLFDAMGRAISDLRNHLDYLNHSSNNNDDVVLVTVITDGYENASKEYTGPAIKALVEEMRKKGWVFTYIGANQDVDRVAESMSINNRMAFQSDSEGTRAMFEKERISRGKFFQKVSCRKSISKEAFENDFFAD